MKTAFLNGADKDDVAAASVHQLLLDEFKAMRWNVETFVLRDLDIANCMGEFFCWIKTPGVCMSNDANRVIAQAVIHSDLLVLLTPVTFGGYSFQLKKAVDHLIPNIAPFFAKIEGETHHQKRYDRYPCFVSIGLLPAADAESERIFQTLVHRNAINMHAPAYTSAVIYHHQEKSEIHRRIKALLAQMEVKQ